METIGDGAVLAGFFALAMGLIEVIKGLALKRGNGGEKKSAKHCSMSLEILKAQQRTAVAIERMADHVGEMVAEQRTQGVKVDELVAASRTRRDTGAG